DARLQARSFQRRQHHALGDFSHHGTALNAVILNDLARVLLRLLTRKFAGDGIEAGCGNEVLRERIGAASQYDQNDLFHGNRESNRRNRHWPVSRNSNVQSAQMATGAPPSPQPRRRLSFLHPGREHTARSAALLVMLAVLLSRVIGYLREAYIAWAFGAGHVTDAYVAAFTLPDWLNYLVAGGTASITFISIYTRFLAEKREDEAHKTFSIIITVMTLVLLIGIGLAEIFAPNIERHLFPRFDAPQ